MTRRLREALGPLEKRRIGRCPVQAERLAEDLALLDKLEAFEIRFDQTQASALKEVVGINRPDLQATYDGIRLLIEYDRLATLRGAEHAVRILANDPRALLVLRTFGR